MAVGADLRFEVSVPGRDAVRGSLRGEGSDLVLELDDPSLLAGTARSGASLGMAETVAALGVRIRVVCRGVHLASIGAVSAPWWQRPATRSRRIRLGSLRGVWMARSAVRSGAHSLLPDLSTIPPTVFPLAPTFVRPRQRSIATTHGVGPSGAPRLFVLPGDRSFDGEEQRSFGLDEPVTVIGSDASCDIVLSGLEAQHAEVRHDDNDEYVIVPSPGADVSVNGSRTARMLLRTGSRIEIGPWKLAYVRPEFADHGRPYGGRSGGEAGYQRPQRSRSDGA